MHQIHIRRRLATSFFIGFVHLAIVAALLRHANSSRSDETGPVEYMSYIVVPKLVTPPVREPTVPAPRRATRRIRPPVDAVQTAPVPSVISAPESAEERGLPAAEAPAPSASPSPKFDMAALRADARRIGKDYAPDSFEQVRDAESRLEAEKNKLGRAIEKAKRPPCTKKYSGGTSLNLVLLIPLAIDTITDTGCKW